MRTALPAKPARQRPAGRAGDPDRPAMYSGGTCAPATRRSSATSGPPWTPCASCCSPETSTDRQRRNGIAAAGDLGRNPSRVPIISGCPAPKKPAPSPLVRQGWPGMLVSLPATPGMGEAKVQAIGNDRQGTAWPQVWTMRAAVVSLLDLSGWHQGDPVLGPKALVSGARAAHCGRHASRRSHWGRHADSESTSAGLDGGAAGPVR